MRLKKLLPVVVVLLNLIRIRILDIRKRII